MAGSTSFPTGIDTFFPPTSANTLFTATHSDRHQEVALAVKAIETKVGVNGSAVTTTHDYKLSGVTGSDKAASAATVTALSSTVTGLTALQSIFTDTGSVNTYVITPSPAVSSYVKGQVFYFTAANANTGASTLNVNGLGAKAIQWENIALPSTASGGGSFINTITPVMVIYDGTQFQLLNPQSNVLAYIQVTTAQTGIGVAVDLTGLTYTTPSIPTGWTKRLEIKGAFLYTNGSSVPVLTTINADGSDVQLSQIFSSNTVNAFSGMIEYDVIPASGSTHTYKLRGASSSGTASLGASATSPCFIKVTVQ